jgi:hypothetical protein
LGGAQVFVAGVEVKSTSTILDSPQYFSENAVENAFAIPGWDADFKDVTALRDVF